MAQANVVLLDNARIAREKAARARRLSDGMTDGVTIERLQAYAVELEERAKEYERMAAELGETVARTQQLTSELKEVVAQVRDTVDKMKDPAKE